MDKVLTERHKEIKQEQNEDENNNKMKKVTSNRKMKLKIRKCDMKKVG